MQKRIINLVWIILFSVLGLYSLSFAQATTEELTITTYYPSPIGQYAELTSQGGNTAWTSTAGWTKALIIGGTGGQAIQFTNSGGTTQHFGLGARNNNNFYGWYTNSTGITDGAHYWLQVNAGAATPVITLSGDLSVSARSNTCRRMQYTSNDPATQDCSLLGANYYLASSVYSSAIPTDGWFICCLVDN